MQITIKSISGQIVNLDVTHKTTIGDILPILSEKLNLPIEKIKLVYAGRCIENEQDRTLESWDIKDNSIIHLAKKQSSLNLTISIDEYNNIVELINNQQVEIEKLKKLLEDDASINLQWKSYNYE